MAEVEILAVEEIRLVESTDLVEGAAPNQDRRRGQACDSLGHVGHPIDVIGEHSDAATHCAHRCETQEPAGPHGATEEMDGSELATLAPLWQTRQTVDDHALRGADPRVLAQGANPRLRARVVRFRVRIQEQDVWRGGRRDPAVLAGAKSWVRRIREHARAGVARDRTGIVVTVIDNDDLPDSRKTLPRPRRTTRSCRGSRKRR